MQPINPRVCGGTALIVLLLLTLLHLWWHMRRFLCTSYEPFDRVNLLTSTPSSPNNTMAAIKTVFFVCENKQKD